MSSNSAKSGKLSKPLLPQSFLQKLKADPSTAISVTQKGSFSYTPEGHEVRMKMRNWQRPWSPDAVELDDPPHFLGGMNYIPLLSLSAAVLLHKWLQYTFYACRWEYVALDGVEWRCHSRRRIPLLRGHP